LSNAELPVSLARLAGWFFYELDSLCKWQIALWQSLFHSEIIQNKTGIRFKVVFLGQTIGRFHPEFIEMLIPRYWTPI
jgi:hypothetical protein